MKSIYFLSLFFLLAGNSFAQEGTNFEDISFQDALIKAQTAGKPLFIDCYTKTCVPCQYMIKFIFSQKECGDYFNSRYICIKKDMEHGDGLEISKKYNIQIYPTYLVLKPDGSEYCRLLGGVSCPEDDFVQKVKDALILAKFNLQYARGKRDQNFLDSYLAFLRQHDKSQLQIVMGEVMLGLEIDKLCEKDNWALVKTELHQIDNPLFRYLLDHQEAFANKLGQEVEEKIMTEFVNEFRTCKMMGLNYESRMADLKKMEYKSHNIAARSLRYQMFFYHVINDRKGEQINDVLTILRDSITPFFPEIDQIAISRELRGFERIATEEQKKRACVYLQDWSKKLQSPEEVLDMIKRLSASFR